MGESIIDDDGSSRCSAARRRCGRLRRARSNRRRRSSVCSLPARPRARSSSSTFFAMACAPWVRSRAATFASSTGSPTASSTGFPGLAAELVRLDPHVIVSTPLPANLAIAKATSTIPDRDGIGRGPRRLRSGEEPFASRAATSPGLPISPRNWPASRSISCASCCRGWRASLRSSTWRTRCTCRNGARPRPRLCRPRSRWSRSNSTAPISWRRPLPAFVQGTALMRCWSRPM